MHGENGPTIDLEEVASVVAEAEVLIVGFPICAERLLLALRPDDHPPPMIDLVAPLTSAEERAAWLRTLRPSLGIPQRSVFFNWPHSIDYLESCGVLERAATRVRSEHGLDVASRVESVLYRLRRRERDFTQRALAGSEGFATLWSATAPRG